MTRTFKALVAFAILLGLVFVVVGKTQASEEPQVIRVTLTDYQVTLSQYLVSPGRAVELVVSNRSSLAHQLQVQPFANASAAPLPDGTMVGAGTSRTIRYVLTPGVYRVACAVADHADRGMLNVLVAQPASQTLLPGRIDLMLPLFMLFGLCAYIVGDSWGLRLWKTARS